MLHFLRQKYSKGRPMCHSCRTDSSCGTKVLSVFIKMICTKKEWLLCNYLMVPHFDGFSIHTDFQPLSQFFQFVRVN